MNQTTISAPAGSSERLPLGGLLALAMAAFITLLTEIMPAGVLSSIAGDLKVSESLAGQFITAYAVGALVAAIPLTALTQGMRRRPLLLSAICGFAIVNLVTALSHDYHVSLATRFFAGVFGGIVWSLLAGYAVRMSPAHLGGRAIAISGAGATLALVLGVPLGTLLGRAIGWQGAFGLMTLMAVMLVVWIIAIVPDFPGQAKAHRPSLSGVFLQCGIRAVLFVVFTFIVAHNILYIYLEPFLTPSGLSERVDIVLFIFGLGAIAGLGVAGMLVDRRVQSLTVMSIVIFALAAVLLASGGRIARWSISPSHCGAWLSVALPPSRRRHCHAFPAARPTWRSPCIRRAGIPPWPPVARSAACCSTRAERPLLPGPSSGSSSCL